MREKIILTLASLLILVWRITTLVFIETGSGPRSGGRPGWNYFLVIFAEILSIAVMVNFVSLPLI